jgi:class 3 adenylate cyclase
MSDSPTVLVVDDRPESVQVISDLLAAEGYQVATAFTGQEALDSIRWRLPDLVLLDLNMPMMNGYEVCERLKADPTTADIPVLMLTAWADPDHRVRGLQLGAADYLVKPFDYRELLARIQTRLQAKQETDRLRAAQEAIRDTFERYVPPHVVQRLLADPTRVRLGGTQQTITVLFADLRGYTALAESLPPGELLEVLNGHLTVAANAVLAYEGTISQYVGDLVMAVFNAPLRQPDHASRAVQAALQIRRDLETFHAKLPSELRMEFGIGIASGEAIVGNIGAREFFHYTAVGDTVNLAQRLEEMAHGSEILLTESTQQLLDGTALRLAPRGLTSIRGRSVPITIFALLGAEGTESL